MRSIQLDEDGRGETVTGSGSLGRVTLPDDCH
jgi:hypothetical protein